MCSPSNTFTVTWINAPPQGNKAQSMFLEVVNTNSNTGYFPTNALNGGPVIMLAAPSTNTFSFQFDGTNFWTESGQILTTGAGDTNVFNIQPVVHSATLKNTNLVAGNIGWVEKIETGTGGANTNFQLFVTDSGKYIINGFTNVSLRAIYGGAVGVTYSFSITITNGSGNNRTVEFSNATNRWRWSYGQAATAPTTLTNLTELQIMGEISNTNITASYAYYPWP
jgi:hypothetical protein